MADCERIRVRARIYGIVQGVGFRPHVYRLASSRELGGWVLNDTDGVRLEVEGAAPAVHVFLRLLESQAPPLARIERLEWSEVAPTGEEEGFRIRSSEGGTASTALVGPDTATCEACLGEIFDPADRRYRYAFTNCTDCGPRFTIVRDVPYDRPNTTMAGFRMCEACAGEYRDPADRRFHAQPNACPACGPRLRIVPSPAADRRESRRIGGGTDRGRDGSAASSGPGGGSDPVAAAAGAILAGRIVAVKGLGGYHLACRADQEEVVARLRKRKHREDKPFAVMVADLEEARRLIRAGAEEEALLAGPERPIVLVRRRSGARVAESVAPGHRDLGVMLPYTPLHHLLVADAGVALVMTSGNVSEEPIAFRDEDALDRLAGIADLFLLHDRPIETRTDDSVVRVVDVGGERRPLMLRRSRGYVPVSVDLPVDAPALLATGAELKNTFCLGVGRKAWLSHHVGDLENWETLRSFREGIDHLRRLTDVEPSRVVHDLHPEYLSTKHALDALRDLPPVGVQHHHAHLAACLAEHGRTGPAVGVIYDGTGYGADGTIWGGEILLGDLDGFLRVGHLWPTRLPGGSAAIREPWRMACAWLVEADAAVGDGGSEAPPRIPFRLEGRVDPERWRTVARLARSGLSSPVTSSMGRLFDAVSALCGIRSEISYEGQAAIELEAAADPGVADAYPLPLAREGGALLLDPRPVLRSIRRDLAEGVRVASVSARFHNAVADATVAACRDLAGEAGCEEVVLSGGVFQNSLLLESTVGRLQREGLCPLLPERIPPNDGGISFGQLAVAAARWSHGNL